MHGTTVKIKLRDLSGCCDIFQKFPCSMVISSIVISSIVISSIVISSIVTSSMRDLIFFYTSSCDLGFVLKVEAIINNFRAE